MIDQATWGSSKVYEDGTLAGDFDPQYVIVHWGGLTSEVDTISKEKSTLQGWQRYHLRKGWQDIAYNYAIGESGLMYRLRGENHGGHTSGTDPVTGKSWSTVGVGIVWIGGKRDEDGPSDAALAAMQSYCTQRGLPILGHSTTGKATACPGPDWLRFVDDYEPSEGEDMTTYYRIGQEAPSYEDITWLLFQLEGGVIDPNRNSSQVADLLGKTNVRLITESDFDLIADYTGLSAGKRTALKDGGLYRYGKEIAALKQFAWRDR